MNVSDRTFLMHLGGRLEIQSKVPIKNRDNLSHVYTPGVARVCMALYDDPQKAYSLTIKRNTVAVITDGTAVLGLGDIGPIALMPVMEGKSMLFKEKAGIDSFPICLDTKIPVFHDDQHGTAVAVMDGLDLSDINVVFSGTGAAGMACTKMLLSAGVKNIVGTSKGVGILRRGVTYDNPTNSMVC